MHEIHSICTGICICWCISNQYVYQLLSYVHMYSMNAYTIYKNYACTYTYIYKYTPTNTYT